MAGDIRFSLVVAAYNEVGDIGDCLDALVALEYPNKEIIAVDDASTDRTPEIIDSYADDHNEVVALQNETNSGVAGTRNRGLERATGDVVVIVNADVLLRPDHLDRLAAHYKAGADFVVCRSVVENAETAVGTFIQAQEDHYLASDVDRVWSEGWSARREILEEAGGFDERYPSASGEDAALGYELAEKYEKVVDNDITVPHVAPEDTDVFRRERQGRGRGRAYYELLHEGDSMPGKFRAEFGKLALFALLFPVTVPLSLAFLGRRALHYYRLEGRYPLALFVLTVLDTVERRRGYYRTLWRERNSEA